ncbi:hypothetical protein OIY81_220 [Cryptosporidium canis]|nr:hypothetical protein OIY81_220 [Cryptosporidium canis]
MRILDRVHHNRLGTQAECKESDQSDSADGCVLGHQGEETDNEEEAKEDRTGPQGFGERRSQGHACWSDVSDLESSVSDLECVRSSPQHAGHHFDRLLHTDLLHIIRRLRGGAPQPADTHLVREVSRFRLCPGSHLLHQLRQQQDLPQHSLLRPGLPRLLPAKHLQDSEAGLSLPGILHHLPAICHVQLRDRASHGRPSVPEGLQLRDLLLLLAPDLHPGRLVRQEHYLQEGGVHCCGDLGPNAPDLPDPLRRPQLQLWDRPSSEPDPKLLLH